MKEGGGCTGGGRAYKLGLTGKKWVRQRDTSDKISDGEKDSSNIIDMETTSEEHDEDGAGGVRGGREQRSTRLHTYNRGSSPLRRL